MHDYNYALHLQDLGSLSWLGQNSFCTPVVMWLLRLLQREFRQSLVQLICRTGCNIFFIPSSGVTSFLFIFFLSADLLSLLLLNHLQKRRQHRNPSVKMRCHRSQSPSYTSCTITCSIHPLWLPVVASLVLWQVDIGSHHNEWVSNSLSSNPLSTCNAYLFSHSYCTCFEV